MEFYNVKKRENVKVDDKKCTKIIYVRETANGTQERYAIRAKDGETKLTKFISKATFDSLTCPVEKAAPKAEKKAEKKK